MLEIGGVKFRSSVSAFHDGVDQGAEVPITLRAYDEDRNLDYLQLVTEEGQVLDQRNCEFSMREECSLNLAVMAPQGHSSTLKFFGVAIDERGEQSSPIEFSVTTLVQPVSFAAGEAAVLEHSSGARIEIPAEASMGLAKGETATASIREVLQPEDSLLKVGRVFDFTVADSSGDKVVIEQPVAVTLPYDLPEGKNIDDLVILHWDESVGRWEDLPIADVDMETGTATVRTQDLSFFGETTFRRVSEYIIESAQNLLGEHLQHQYDTGVKHLVSIRGEQGILEGRIIGIPGEAGILKGGIVFDLDDLMQITEEGREGYVTFWINYGAEAATFELGYTLPAGIWYSLYDMDHQTNRHDPTFDGSFSLATLDTTAGSTDVLTINRNGNIHPLHLQREVCLTCGVGVGVSFGDFSANAVKGELDKEKFIELLDDTLNVNRFEFVVAAASPLLVGTHLMASLFESLRDEERPLVAPFTYFDDPGPATVGQFEETLFNRITGASGGLDRSGDGRGDMVFPSQGPDGTALTDIPLSLVVAPDLREDRDYYVELLEVTEGWEVRVDPNRQQGNSRTDRYEFHAPALFPVRTHWLVSSTPTASDPGQARFALVREQDGSSEIVHGDYIVELRRDRVLSDLWVSSVSSPLPVRLGEDVTYHLSITNGGPDLAGSVSFRILGLHGELPLRGATSPTRHINCVQSESEGHVCDVGHMEVGQTIYVTLEFPPFESIPARDIAAAPLLVTLESDGDGAAAGVGQDENTFAVARVGDPTTQNNLAFTRTRIEPQNLLSADGNCYAGVVCLTSEEVPLSGAESAVKEEFGEDWRVAGYTQLLVEALNNLLKSGEAAYVGGAHNDAGQWPFVHHGEPGKEYLDTDVGRVLAIHESLVYSRNDYEAGRDRWVTTTVYAGGIGIPMPRILPSSGGTIEVHMSIWNSSQLGIFGPEVSGGPDPQSCGVFRPRPTGFCVYFSLPPNPTGVDRTYQIIRTSGEHSLQATTEAVVSAYPRWVDAAPKVMPSALSSDGGTILVEIPTHELDSQGEAHQAASPPTMSITGPDLAESTHATFSESGCINAASPAYVTRCWTTDFDLPANETSRDRTYVMTIESAHIPVVLTKEVVVPAAGS